MESDNAASSVLEIRYYPKQPSLVFVLSLLSLNLYSIWWFYKNYKAIQNSTKAKISPFWMGFFSILFANDLFTIIMADARAKGYTSNYSPHWLAAAYSTSFVCGNIYSLFFTKISIPLNLIFLMLLIAIPLTLIPMQQAVNFILSKDNPDFSLRKSFSWKEITLLIIGGINFIFFLIALFVSTKW
jgi:hypothetical protein